MADKHGTAQGTIHIGTSGWSYKHWKGGFYPITLPAKQYLAYYTEHYDTVEINSSFYHLPLETTVLNWIAQVPEGFRFCVKMSRFLSHMKKLTEPGEPLARFFDLFAPMKAFMGPVLIQLPANLPFDAGVVHPFYEALQRDYKDYRFAMEVRHTSWLERESFALMEHYGIILVFAQARGFPYTETITAKDIYLRLHGPGKLYDSGYDEKALAAYARKIEQWQAQGQEVWVFFNNDMHHHALENADRLKQLLKLT
ncbi:DUF72 domain-containing protein [Taibaiella helva]|uniref:DUF72 domain-containing protein n=1 Tax=Taibaiella helva TaxID=2301235 RepID=UPI000E5759D3|nr:DUF72 domain-containing protein [Taibaiella helva]